MSDKNYTVPEVAVILRITEYTVREKLREGKIKGHKPGGKWLISEQELKNYLEVQHG